jgi:hypothetical protein
VQFVVRREEYLESAIEPEPLDDVCTDPPANRICRIQDEHVDPFIVRPSSACQPREACTDHEKFDALWDIPVSHVFISRSS